MNGILGYLCPVTHRLLGAVCGESRKHGFEGEVRPSNGDIDSNSVAKHGDWGFLNHPAPLMTLGHYWSEVFSSSPPVHPHPMSTATGGDFRDTVKTCIFDILELR